MSGRKYKKKNGESQSPKKGLGKVLLALPTLATTSVLIKNWPGDPVTQNGRIWGNWAIFQGLECARDFGPDIILCVRGGADDTYLLVSCPKKEGNKERQVRVASELRLWARREGVRWLSVSAREVLEEAGEERPLWVWIEQADEKRIIEVFQAVLEKKINEANKAEIEEEEEEELATLFTPLGGEYFVGIDGYFYRIKDTGKGTGKGKEIKRLGPALVPARVVIDVDQKHKKTVRWREARSALLGEGEEIELSDFSISAIEKATMKFVLATTIYKDAINTALDRALPTLPRTYLLRNCGWKTLDGLGERLYTPFHKREGVEWQHKLSHLFEPSSEPPGAHKDAIFTLLQEGKLGGVIAACAVSSILLKDLKLHGYTVVISGLAGKGKTMLAKLATSIFYRGNEEINLWATQVAQEQILASLSDLPVLLDEAALSWDDRVQALVFMLSSGEGKKRSNLRLAVNFTRLRSVLFLTSEKEVQFTRRGAYRRLLSVNIANWEDLTKVYSPTSVARLLESWGWGEELIDYYIAHKEEILKATQERTQALMGQGVFPASSQFWKAILGAVELLERFFEVPLERLRRRVEQLMMEHRDKVERDEAREIVEALAEWITVNQKRFSVANNPQEVWGEKVGEDTIFVLKTPFRKRFCAEYGYTPDVVLDLLDKRGYLIREKTDRYVYRKRLGGAEVAGYLFNLYPPTPVPTPANTEEEGIPALAS